MTTELLQRRIAKKIVKDFSQPLLAKKSSFGKYYKTDCEYLYAVIQNGQPAEIFPTFDGAWRCFYMNLQPDDLIVNIIDDGIRKIEHLLR
jgi:hypothetical protein